ncbi:hypothetical protein AK812_SmicGene20236 [Symbiodinium microadriaticum]|uniref:Tyr recombinase domain-containing protein n=1 Tax=Symbiodinium microadriaticum TaxID=2951 RepID=A0A1Q9DQJ4_SYMMI|nr:hypothetical protein AK812_SmicGene20236 [Symbiodinium microadriaticum]
MPAVHGPVASEKTVLYLIDVAAEDVDRLQVALSDLESRCLAPTLAERGLVASDPPDRLDANFTCGSEEKLLPLAASVAKTIQNDVQTADACGTAAAAREPENASMTKAKLATVSKPIDPSRLSFDEAPRFKAEKFLVDPLLRAGFRDPRIFRRHEDEWPRPKVARVQAPLDKQLQLYKKWDDVECLHLIPASSSEYRYRCGLFSVYKSDTLDRQILNPIPENSPSYSVSEVLILPGGGVIDQNCTIFLSSDVSAAWQWARTLRLRPLDTLYCTDASPFAAGQLTEGFLFDLLEADFCFCTYGSPFMTPSRWLANNSDLLKMRGDYRHFDLVRRADDCLGAPGRRRQDFLVARSEVNVDATGGLLLSTTLVAYGKYLFYSGSPKYIFSETINSCTDRFKHFRSYFAAAWGVLSRWEEEEPQERSIIPEAVYKASITVALLWGWPFFTAALLLGFHGLLRPGEFLKLRRRDLILPRDLLTSTPIAYVRILGAKTKRFLQRQHAKISDVLAVRFLEALYGSAPRAEPLFNCSPAVFRRRWNCLFQHLGVPTGDNEQGVTPKCLRGSGATWLYQLTEDIGRIQWRGRWQQRRTLEHYLQDVAGQLLLTDLTESQRSAVLELAPFAATFLSLYVSSLLRT